MTERPGRWYGRRNAAADTLAMFRGIIIVSADGWQMPPLMPARLQISRRRSFQAFIMCCFPCSSPRAHRSLSYRGFRIKSSFSASLALRAYAERFVSLFIFAKNMSHHYRLFRLPTRALLCAVTLPRITSRFHDTAISRARIDEPWLFATRHKSCAGLIFIY